MNLKALQAVLFLVLSASPMAFGHSTPKPEKPLTCDDILPTLGVVVHAHIEAPPTKGAVSYLQGGLNKVERHYLAQQLTHTHAAYDNSFQTKNPVTGIYDRTVAVPVSPFVAAIPEQQFQKVVKASEPLLVAFRRLLQRIYSQPNLTISNLGLSHLPQADAELMLAIIKGSIYFEPAMVAENMRDYPFIAVAGLDGAIGNPQKMETRFFEVNLGTPSGLSNNIQLEQSYAHLNRHHYQTLRPLLGPDETYSILRRTIESNAMSWTGVNGMAVIVSPGEYNAAHPDVVAISRYTGMPLVRPQDLYVGKDHYVYWNVGPERDHPRVTGIYGRRDESYFLQTSEGDRAIPMINPNLIKTNEELSLKLGLKLRSAAWYKYVYDDQGKIVDIERNDHGQPIIDEVYDRIGTDPKGANPGGFAKAIRERRLYYSALGGRVVDDKRIFPLVAKYLVKSRAVNQAEPVRSLARDQYHLLYANPNMFFVKEPDKSGGEGVKPLALETPENKKALLDKVKADPDKYEVQYVADMTTLPIVIEQEGHYAIDNVPTDLRFFVMLDAEGNARAGRNSLLLRTAPSGQLLTNTSRNGGYGIAFVYRGQRSFGQSNSVQENYLVQPTALVSPERIENLRQAMRQMSEWVFQATATGADESQLRPAAGNLVFQIRAVMDLLPKELHPIISILRNYSENGASDLNQLRQSLAEWHLAVRGQLENGVFPVLDGKKVVNDFIYSDAWRFRLRGLVHDYDARNIFTFHAFKNPEMAFPPKQELGYYEIKNHPFLQAAAKELAELGGELRLARNVFEDGSTKYAPPYFWVNYSFPALSSYLKPIITANLDSDMALLIVAHELGHFRYFKIIYHQARARGLSHERAMESAARTITEQEHMIKSERMAVSSEMAMEAATSYDPLLRRPIEEREFAQTQFDLGYVNRITYPEFSYLRMILVKGTLIADANLIQGFIAGLVDAALRGRQTALADLEKMKQADRFEMGRSRDLRVLSKQFQSASSLELLNKQIERWQNATVLELLTLPSGQTELSGQGSWESFQALIAAELGDRGLDEFGNPKK